MTHFYNLSPAEAHLQLTFVRTERGTQLISQRTRSPFVVQRPFYPEGAEICHGLLIHNGGGLVGGDRLSGEIRLQRGAQALITTVAATKVYRSLGAVSQQTTLMEVEPGGCLEWLPQETIIFNGANYRQNLRVELSPDALWLGWDMTRFGRTARGERFQSGYWRSDTEVWQNDIPLWIDKQELVGGQPGLDSWQGLAGCPIVASLAFIGQTVTPEIVDSARQLGGERERQGIIGVTRLESGFLCRYRGHSRALAQAWLIEVWNLLRLTYRHRPACCPRVWQIPRTSTEAVHK